MQKNNFKLLENLKKYRKCPTLIADKHLIQNSFSFAKYNKKYHVINSNLEVRDGLIEEEVVSEVRESSYDPPFESSFIVTFSFWCSLILLLLLLAGLSTVL